MFTILFPLVLLSFQDKTYTDAELYSMCKPSVVQIWTKEIKAKDFDFNGTGFVAKFHEKTYLFTARHVVDKAHYDAVEIHYADKKIKSKIIYQGKNSDFAVLEWKSDTLPALNAVDTSDPVGTHVAIVGFPFVGNKIYGPMLSTGCINQEMLTEVIQDEGVKYSLKVLGVSIVFYGGDSGSPVIDSSGNVIGVTTAAYGNSTISFITPFSEIQKEKFEIKTVY